MGSSIGPMRASQVLVVSGGHAQKLHALPPQRAYRLDDVTGGHGDVLHAGTAVELQILLDLRLALALGRLVDGELHALVAVRHHLRHQRRIFRGDVLVVEVLEHAEAHHVAIEIHPAVHLAPAHVAHHVVDVLAGPRAAPPRRRPPRPRSPAERRRCNCAARRKCGWCRRRWRWRPCALRRARRAASPARARCARRAGWSRATPIRHRPPTARYRARHRRALRTCSAIGWSGRERRGEHEADLVLLQHIGGAVARAGLRAAIGRQPECRTPSGSNRPPGARCRHRTPRSRCRSAAGNPSQPVRDAPAICGITPPQCLDAAGDCPRRCRSKSAGNCGSPNAFSGRTTTPCASSSSKMRLALLLAGQNGHHEIRLRRDHGQPQIARGLR